MQHITEYEAGQFRRQLLGLEANFVREAGSSIGDFIFAIFKPFAYAAGIFVILGYAGRKLGVIEGPVVSGPVIKRRKD